MTNSKRKRLQTWYNVREEQGNRVKAYYPNRKRFGLGVFIIGIILFSGFFLVMWIAPKEPLPYRVDEIYRYEEPFQSLSSLSIISGVAVVVIGGILIFESWKYEEVEKPKTKQKEDTEKKEQ